MFLLWGAKVAQLPVSFSSPKTESLQNTCRTLGDLPVWILHQRQSLPGRPDHRPKSCHTRCQKSPGTFGMTTTTTMMMRAVWVPPKRLTNQDGTQKSSQKTPILHPDDSEAPKILEAAFQSALLFRSQFLELQSESCLRTFWRFPEQIYRPRNTCRYLRTRPARNDFFAGPTVQLLDCALMSASKSEDKESGLRMPQHVFGGDDGVRWCELGSGSFRLLQSHKDISPLVTSVFSRKQIYHVWHICISAVIWTRARSGVPTRSAKMLGHPGGTPNLAAFINSK